MCLPSPSVGSGTARTIPYLLDVADYLPIRTYLLES